jgi:hypothetical protein
VSIFACVMLAVEDIEDVLARLHAHGTELVSAHQKPGVPCVPGSELGSHTAGGDAAVRGATPPGRHTPNRDPGPQG